MVFTEKESTFAPLFLKRNKLGKFTAYKVQLASMRDGHHEQDFEIGTEFFRNMENTDIISADIKAHLDIDKKNDVYDCTFHVKGMLQIPCDRCLDPIDHEVDTEYHVIVKYGEDYDDADGLLILPYSNTYLNVAYILNDTILLTIPLRHVHPMGKCNRAMAAALHKHRSNVDEETEEQLDEVDAELAGEDAED